MGTPIAGCSGASFHLTAPLAAAGPRPPEHPAGCRMIRAVIFTPVWE